MTDPVAFVEARTTAKTLASQIHPSVLVARAAVEGPNQNAFEAWSDNLSRPIREGVENTRKDYPDVQWTIRSATAEGDVVSFQYIAKGTHAATGRVVTWTGSAVAKVENGVVTKLAGWTEDKLAERLQHGVIPRFGFGGVTGRWLGSLHGVGVVAQLEHAPSGELWGSLDVSNVGRFSGSGTVSGSDVRFSAVDSAGRTLDFVGTKNGNQLVGNVNGHDLPIALNMI